MGCQHPFGKSLCLLCQLSILTERISLSKNMVKNACVHFGRVERQANDLMVNDQGELSLSAAWRLSEGRKVER